MSMLAILEDFGELLPHLGYWCHPSPSVVQAAYKNVAVMNVFLERLEDANLSPETRTEVGEQIKELFDAKRADLETSLESEIS